MSLFVTVKEVANVVGTMSSNPKHMVLSNHNNHDVIAKT